MKSNDRSGRMRGHGIKDFWNRHKRKLGAAALAAAAAGAAYGAHKHKGDITDYLANGLTRGKHYLHDKTVGAATRAATTAAESAADAARQRIDEIKTAAYDNTIGAVRQKVDNLKTAAYDNTIGAAKKLPGKAAQKYSDSFDHAFTPWLQRANDWKYGRTGRYKDDDGDTFFDAAETPGQLARGRGRRRKRGRGIRDWLNKHKGKIATAAALAAGAYGAHKYNHEFSQSAIDKRSDQRWKDHSAIIRQRLIDKGIDPDYRPSERNRVPHWVDLDGSTTQA